MKTLTKKVLLACLAALLTVSCVSFAAFAFNRSVAKADETELESEFTNNGQFAITKSDWNNDYSFIDGATVGGSGAVLQVNFCANVVAFKLDLSSCGLRAAEVESIVVRIKAYNFTLGADEFRTDKNAGLSWVKYDKTDDLSDWFDYTLNSSSMSQLRNADGTLGSINIAIRTDNADLVAYVDSITITESATVGYKSEFTNNGQFSLSQYSNITYEYVDGADEDLPTGYDGVVLKVNNVSNLAYVTVDFSASHILALTVGSVLVRIYSPGYTSADEFRTLMPQRFYGAGKYDMSSWCDIPLSANSIADMTDEDGYLTSLSIGVRIKSGASVYYIDSITITERDKTPVNYSGITWNNKGYNAFEGKKGVLINFDANLSLIQSEIDGGLQSVNLKDVYGSRIKINGETLDEIADAELVYHSQGHLWIYAPNMTTWAENIPTIEIEENAPFSYSYLPALTLYFDSVAQKWHEPFTAFNGIDESSSAKSVALNFNDDSEWTDNQGNLADYIRLDTTGTLADDGGNIAVDSANKKVTINVVGDYSKLQIISGGKIAGVSLPEITVYKAADSWSVKPQNSTALTDIGAYDNNNRLDKTVYHTVLQFADYFIINGTGADKDAANMAASLDYDLATKAKLNGKTFNELYQENELFYIGYMAGGRYLTFRIPKEYLDGEPENDYLLHTLTIEGGTAFMDKLLPEINLLCFDGVWLNGDGFNPEPIAYNGIAYGWNCIKNGVNIDTILQFGEYGVDFLGGDNGVVSHADETNLAKTSAQIAAKLTINGVSASEINGITVSYAHGYNYLYISLPQYALYPVGDYKCVVLHIEDRTVFKDSVLSEVTLYLFDGQWTETEPETITESDDEYLTADDIFGDAQGDYFVSGEFIKVSDAATDGDTVCNFMYRAKSYEFAYELSSHVGDDFGGVKVRVLGGRSDGKNVQTIQLFIGAGEAKGSEKISFAEGEWYALRVAIAFEYGRINASVAVDGIVIVKASDTFAAVGNGLELISEGEIDFANYRTGDVKKPIINWQGKNVYRYTAGGEKPSDLAFTRVISATDNHDKGDFTAEDFIIEWQDGAVEDGKLVAGEWTISISVYDKAGNVSFLNVTAIVTDFEKITVTFNANAEKTYAKNDKGALIEKPADPEKAGDEYANYVFDGWYLGDKKWDFANDYAFEDVELTAVFTPEYKEYTVTVIGEGLKNNYSYTFKLRFGSLLNEDILKRDGYEYKLIKDGKEISAIRVDGDMQIKAVYTPNPTETDSTESDSAESEQTSEKKSGCLSSVDTSFGGFILGIFVCAYIILKKSFKKGDKEHE